MLREWKKVNAQKLPNWKEKDFNNLIDWLDGDIFGMDIWVKKYCNNGEKLDDWFNRVSGGDDEVKQLIKEKKFLFGGRILANRGLQNQGRKVTYSNCYVITPPEDNLESIFECAKKLARTFSYGGGCGIDISGLSPAGAKINNAAKVTSGAVSFMDLYNTTTGLIGQNGRRGALMVSISSEHPDLENFIQIKDDLSKLGKCNISVRISDEFMFAVKNDATWNLVFKREETGEDIRKEVKARDIFGMICKSAWDTGEPGMLFWDTIKTYNLNVNHPDFDYAGVNPCAEEPLPAGGSCLLGALNLAAFVRDDGKFYHDEFMKAIFIAVRALNDVLDEGLELHPLEEQRNSVRDWRQIGLGIMGLADCLTKMGIRYGSEQSLDVSDMIGSVLADTAIQASALLAKQYGPYPKYKHEFLISNMDNHLYRDDFYYQNAMEDTRSNVEKYGLRNSQLLTIAPTGSIANLIGVSNGIEPIFAYKYTRKTESLHGEDVYYDITSKTVKDYMGSRGLDPDGDIIDLPDYFITSHELDYVDRIDMQSVWQRHIDASISSTINLPQTTTVEEIGAIYMLAWEKQLKGLTIFRDGCKRVGILTLEKGNDLVFDKHKPITRAELGERLFGSTYIRRNACGKMYITINHDEKGNLAEVFIDSGKSGGCAANAESLGRLASLCMRGGLDVASIVDATKGVRCAACMQAKGNKDKIIHGLSCGDILAKTIFEEYLRLHETDGIDDVNYNPTCPECGEPLTAEGGCWTCLSCGYSKCD